MKKSLIIGMLIAVTCQMSLAAGAKSVEAVRKSVSEEVIRAGAKESQGARPTSGRIAIETTETLVKIGKNAEKSEIQAALNRTIPVGDKKVALLDIGQTVLKADQAVTRINRNDLDAKGQAHLDATREAIQVSAEFIGLANRTSDMSHVSSEQSQLEVKAFYKQLALIPDMLTKMDTADVVSHTEFMKKAVAARTNPNMNGDQAMSSVMKKDRPAEDFMEYLRRLADCE